MVPIEVSRGQSSYASLEADQSFERIEVPLDLFLNFLAHSEASMKQGIPVEEVKVYLAQHAIFDSIPELYQDTCLPSYVTARDGHKAVPLYATAGKRDIYNINLWLGFGTHTPVNKS